MDTFQRNARDSQWRDSYEKISKKSKDEYLSEKLAAREAWGMKAKYNSQSSPRLDQDFGSFENEEIKSMRGLDRKGFHVQSDAFLRKKDFEEREYVESQKEVKKKKKTQKSKKDNLDNVKVYLRIRPPTSEYTFINKISKNKKMVDITKDFEIKAFGFNRIISPKEKQLKAFAVTCSDVLKGILQGFNGCLIAYGQTGSGKTFTILGDQDKNEKGLLQLSLAYLLASQKKIWLEISAVQIYMENIYDIFDSEDDSSTNSSRRSMKFSNRNPAHYQIGHLKKVNYNYISKDGMKLHDLLTFRIENIEDVEEVVQCINENRRTGKTNMNEKSSRSHAIFMVKVHNPDFSGYSTFYLVDLAGSERLKKSQIKNKITMDETISINASLMALSKCISALVKGEKKKKKKRKTKGKSVSPGKSEKSDLTRVKNLNMTGDHLARQSISTNVSRNRHIPFRDSKLTMLLQNCLLGKSLLSLIVTISPDDRDVEESFSTLRFGQCAAKMEVKPMKSHEIERQKQREEEEKEKKQKQNFEKKVKKIKKENLQNEMDLMDREMDSNIQRNLSKNIKSLEAKNGKNIFKVDSDQETPSVKSSMSRREQLMKQLITEDNFDLEAPIYEGNLNDDDHFEMYENQIKQRREQGKNLESGERETMEKKDFAEGNNSNFTFQQDNPVGSSGLQNSLYQNITQNVMGNSSTKMEGDNRKVVDSEIVDSNVISSLVQDFDFQDPTSLSNLIKNLKNAKQNPEKISEIIGELKK